MCSSIGNNVYPYQKKTVCECVCVGEGGRDQWLTFKFHFFSPKSFLDIFGKIFFFIAIFLQGWTHSITLSSLYRNLSKYKKGCCYKENKSRTDHSELLMTSWVYESTAKVIGSNRHKKALKNISDWFYKENIWRKFTHFLLSLLVSYLKTFFFCL